MSRSTLVEVARRVTPAFLVTVGLLLLSAALAPPAIASASAGTVPLAVSGPAVVPAAAPDQTTGREITRYDVTAVLGADGRMAVTLDFDFDFGDDPGHGPYLTLVTRQGVDDDRDRLFEYSDIAASSSTGAPAQVNREDTDEAIVLRIGDPDVGDVSGVQTYRVEFTVDGFVNPANERHSGDELFWNVIGSGWEIPIGGVSVTITGPAVPEGQQCFSGPFGATTECDSASSSGDVSTFTQGTVPVGDQLTTTVGWPAGTFPGVEPILVDKPDSLEPLRPLSVGGAVGGAIAAVGSVVAVRRVRRSGRDLAYLGLTPGLRPADAVGGATGHRDKRAPIAVRFTPPDGVLPGELGTLVDESADPVDVTATLVDLAVRGYLHIAEVPRSNPEKKPKDWTLTQLRTDDEGLMAFERTLMHRVFAGRGEVRLSDLKTTFASSMKAVQNGLYEHVTANGWFRANPRTVRQRWAGVGIVLFVVAFVAAFVGLAAIDTLSFPGLLWVPVGIGIVGVVVTVCAKAAPARTGDGTAVLAQALGFRQYLATAEANQLRFEEGEDVFSRYLPYAIVFGLTERWARVFNELAAQGRAVAQPGWYSGYYNPAAGFFWGSAFASSMDRFTSVATESLAAPTPGSSGGSGFSSGGGFSGGGVGGGGGGGW